MVFWAFNGGKVQKKFLGVFFAVVTQLTRRNPGIYSISSFSEFEFYVALKKSGCLTQMFKNYGIFVLYDFILALS